MKDIYQFNRTLKEKRQHPKPAADLYNRSGMATIKEAEDHSYDLIMLSLFEDYKDLPLRELFKQAKRTLRQTGTLIVTGTEPVVSRFRLYGKKYLKHEYVYVLPDCVVPNKPHPVLRGPIPRHLNVLVFSFSYDFHFKPLLRSGTKHLHKHPIMEETNFFFEPDYRDWDWPTSVISDIHKHKPYTDEREWNPHIELFLYLFESYAHKGAKVLDLAADSSNPAVAALHYGVSYRGNVYCSHRYHEAVRKLDFVKKNIKQHH